MYHVNNISVKDIFALTTVHDVLSGGTEIQKEGRPLIGHGFFYCPDFIKVIRGSISQSGCIKKNLCKGRTLYRTISHKESKKRGSNVLTATTIDRQTQFWDNLL